MFKPIHGAFELTSNSQINSGQRRKYKKKKIWYIDFFPKTDLDYKEKGREIEIPTFNSFSINHYNQVDI